MRKIITKIGILFFIICFFYLNNSSAAPMYYYPEKYSITINNINKKDVKKIEIFTPWGYFDDDDKIEIDGRLFNYNNYYYNGVDGEEYSGVKCKIIDTIEKKDIIKTKNGINILLSNIDMPLNLRIYMENEEEIFTDEIEISMIIDEFSHKDEEYVKKVKQFEKSTAYFIGEYHSNKPWVKMEITDEQPIIMKSNNNLIVIKTIVVLVGVTSLIYVLKNKKAKELNK